MNYLNFFGKKLAIAIAILLLAKSLSFSLAITVERLQSAFSQKYGASALPNFTSWLGLIDAVKDSKSDEKIKRVNNFLTVRFYGQMTRKYGGSQIIGLLHLKQLDVQPVIVRTLQSPNTLL